MLEPARYWNKETQSGIWILKYLAKIMNAGIPMPVATAWMPMPSYVKTVRACTGCVARRLRICVPTEDARRGKMILCIPGSETPLNITDAEAYRPPHIWGNICAFPYILGSPLPRIWICNCSTENFLVYEKNLIFFFISVGWAAGERSTYDFW